GRDEDLKPVLLRRLEDPLHVLDGFVLPNAVTHRSPRKAFIAQDFILRIDEDYCSVASIYIHCFVPFYLTRFGSDHSSASLVLRGFVGGLLDQPASFCFCRNSSIRLAISSPCVSSAK